MCLVRPAKKASTSGLVLPRLREVGRLSMRATLVVEEEGPPGAADVL